MNQEISIPFKDLKSVEWVGVWFGGWVGGCVSKWVGPCQIIKNQINLDLIQIIQFHGWVYGWLGGCMGGWVG